MGDEFQGGWLKKSYFGLVQGENFIGHVLLLIIRLYWGGLLVMAGIGKWQHLYEVADFFASLDIPFPVFTAGFVATVECIGGASLFLGLYARIFSLILCILFVVAYITAHQQALIEFFSNPQGFIDEAPFLYLYASLIVLSFGSGFFSCDYWIERKAYGRAL